MQNRYCYIYQLQYHLKHLKLLVQEYLYLLQVKVKYLIEYKINHIKDYRSQRQLRNSIDIHLDMFLVKRLFIWLEV